MLERKQEASEKFKSYWQVYYVYSHVSLFLKVGRKIKLNYQQAKSQ